MTLPISTLKRLEIQLDGLFVVIAGLDQDVLTRRPPSGKWSIIENVAHLGRYQEVFLERMQRILDDDSPDLGRYIAEDDSGFPAWLQSPADAVIRTIKERRSELTSFVIGLKPAQLARSGSHPHLGELNVPLWVEFFLLHEAHHLYRILWLSRRVD